MYQNGAAVYSTLVNTGVLGAITDNGTWPVFACHTVTTMSGTNPDGSHYSDPWIPWVSYFPRWGRSARVRAGPTTASPRSDGCVEMPIANAQTVFGH